MISYVPPPTPHDQNKFWQELEKRLGVSSWNVTIVPDADYQTKFATTVASGSLPDLMWIAPTNYPDQYKTMLQGAFTDLTPYLTGDALKNYPNLAKFPPILWKNVALNKKIYGVPRPRFLANNTMHFRQDWADKVGFSTQKNSDDAAKMFTAMAKNDPDGNGKVDTYGLSCNSPRPQFDVDAFAQMFRAPNMWRANPDGTLMQMWETDEYRKAIDFARQLWTAGAYYPDAVMQSAPQNQASLFAGKIGAFWGGIASLMGSNGFRGKARQFNPNAVLTSWIFPGADGGKPVYHKYIGYFGMVTIPAQAGKDPERVKELLRIIDYLAAPFGSEEWLFATYGIEGVHYVIKDGAPTTTDQGKSDIGDALTGLMNSPPVAFYDEPNDAQDMQKIQASLLANAIDDPTWGYYSPTNIAKTSVLGQMQADQLLAIVLGRQPLSSWDDFLKSWRSQGGDQIRKEYQDAIQG